MPTSPTKDNSIQDVVKKTPPAEVETSPAKVESPAEPGQGETSYASETQGSGDTDGSYFKLDSDAPVAMEEEPPAAAPVSYQPQRVMYRGKDTYVVQSGDSLYKIAEKVYGPGMGSKWRLIRQANPDIDPTAIVVGAKLRIPPHQTSEPASSVAPVAAGPTSTATGRGTYVVSKGDRAGLWGIAKKVYGRGKGYQYVLIQKANPKIDPRKLRAGMKLIIPPLPAAKQVPSEPEAVGRSQALGGATRRIYTVKRNDTIWGIAQIMYGNGKYAKLIIDANPKIDPSRLKPGQKLTLPPSPRPGTTPARRRPGRPVRSAGPPPAPGEPDFGP
jgi:nucleoid-associated protein YgaU